MNCEVLMNERLESKKLPGKSLNINLHNLNEISSSGRSPSCKGLA